LPALQPCAAGLVQSAPILNFGAKTHFALKILLKSSMSLAGVQESFLASSVTDNQIVFY
jgi:hypothetical protein